MIHESREQFQHFRYNADKSIWVEDDIQVKIEVGFQVIL